MFELRAFAHFLYLHICTLVISEHFLIKLKLTFSHLVTPPSPFSVFSPSVAKRQLHIALVGNPNSGKSSLFNALTGMNQKVGNFPGVTVDKKTGNSLISDKMTASIIDLPGTYSLYPRREDEWVAYRVLMQQDPDTKPDMVVLVADASNLKRNLLFVSQIIDLKIPIVLALTMLDLAKRKELVIDVTELERELGIPVIPVNPRKNKGIPQLKKAIEQTANELYKAPARDFIDNHALATSAIGSVKQLFPALSDYKAIHYLINHESFSLEEPIQKKIEDIEAEHKFNHTRVQAEEILQRYHRISAYHEAICFGAVTHAEKIIYR